MSATENQFRGAALGGFNRQDVLTYVENTIAEHGRQMEKIKQELNQAEETCREQAAALGEAEARDTQYAEENQRLSTELDAAKHNLAETSAALAAAELELSALREKVKKLEPGAEAYARIKDRTASIEMEAYLHAQTVLDEAAAHAQECRSKMEDWLRNVQEKYDRLRTDVDATVSHASGELARIQNSLGGITADFAAQDDILADLFHCCIEIPVMKPEAEPSEKN